MLNKTCLLLFATLLFSSAYAKLFASLPIHSELKNSTFGIPSTSISVRQDQNDNNDPMPACPIFDLSYAQVRGAANFFLRKIKALDANKNLCDNACFFCSECKTQRATAFIRQVNTCIKKRSFSICYMALFVLDLLNEVTFPCLPYFKDSTVGNCYAQEYKVLNGKVGEKFVFNREQGQVGSNSFQCRAKTRRNKPLLSNPDPCRTPFRLTLKAVDAVDVCAFPSFAAASTAYSNCLLFVRSPFDSLSCYNQFLFGVSSAFISCIIPHGLPAVGVASYSSGVDALSCAGVFRRDAFVGKCTAPDYVQLKRLGAVNGKDDGTLTFLIPGACDYK